MFPFFNIMRRMYSYKRNAPSRRPILLFFLFLLCLAFLFQYDFFAVLENPENLQRIVTGDLEVDEYYKLGNKWSFFSSPPPSRPCNCKYSSGMYSYSLNNQIKEIRENKTKVLAIVGIQTGFKLYGRREAIRRTWLKSMSSNNSSLNSSTSAALVFKFIIGKSKNAEDENSLALEMNAYNDILRLDVYESYASLNIKTLAFYRLVYSLYDAEYYVKMDDDMYLFPYRLAQVLSKKRKSSRTYIGCMTQGGVINDTSHKWFEPRSDILGVHYFLHASGTFYALSNNAVQSIVNSVPDSLRLLNSEDVALGSWMLAWGVEFEDDQRLCAVQCDENSILIMDWPRCTGLCEPESRMLELYQSGKCFPNPPDLQTNSSSVV